VQEEHKVQDPNVLLTILSKMAQKTEVKFDKLFPKLYNEELWLMAYEQIAPNPGNMTAGADGSTIDGMGMKLVRDTIADLKASRYKPHPVRRIYIEKANGKLRPIGIPGFRDKLLQTVVKLILEAIYEPTFSNVSHGYRPNRSCHTALTQVKRMTGVRWWVEADIAGFFNNLCHNTLLKILNKRITDKRFLHLVEQFLRAGYIEDWKYHRTYSGTPQGGNLSPILSNVYLNELDQRIEEKVQEFNRGKKRRTRREYWRICDRRKRAKKKARQTGDWTAYRALTKKMLETQATDPIDPHFRRMYYSRFADDFLIGIIGSRKDAEAVKAWLSTFLKEELQLELSPEKTLITHAEKRVRFLGYDIKRGSNKRRVKVKNRLGRGIQRTCMQKLILLMPREKCEAFAKEYGQRQGWKGRERIHLAHLSELEILMIYNAEIRGFLGYYALADNLASIASSILWLTTTSFLKTLAAKRRSTLKKVARSLKRGPSRYVVIHRRKDGNSKEYALVASTKQIDWKRITSGNVDLKPNTWIYRRRTELGQRLQAHQCEWCGTKKGPIEVHHVRKLKDLKGKKVWERQMIARRRKTMVLCKKCHVDLHAGRLKRAKKSRENWRAGQRESVTSGSEGRTVKPGVATR
jgi:group II intron reverse transcriptase/maturase